jgi:hypothetical protein
MTPHARKFLLGSPKFACSGGIGQYENINVFNSYSLAARIVRRLCMYIENFDLLHKFEFVCKKVLAL